MCLPYNRTRKTTQPIIKLEVVSLSLKVAIIIFLLHFVIRTPFMTPFNAWGSDHLFWIRSFSEQGLLQ